jgi:hypothetical protein
MEYSQKDLEIAKRLYSTKDEKCERFARSIHKLRESRKRYDDKRDKKRIIFLKEVPEQMIQNRHAFNVCQATTMSGKRCNFKASCGNFCKKHSHGTKNLDISVLGTKPVLKNIML